MSEPSSLFAKISLTKENFKGFLEAKPAIPKLDNDWQEWWKSKEMYGKTELEEKNVYCYQNPTNKLIIDDWQEAKDSCTFSDYNPEDEIWHFGIIMFSENYGEMIPGLAFIRSVAEFKKENPDDFAIVYSYFWGEEHICAYLRYEGRESFFDNSIQHKSDVNADKLTYAEEYLTKKFTGLTGEQE